MLEDTWHMDFPGGSAFPMWESYPIFQTKPKKEDNIGVAEAITKSILLTGDYGNIFYNVVEFEYTVPEPCFIQLTGRIDLQRKLFCSMQLVSYFNTQPRLLLPWFENMTFFDSPDWWSCTE